MSEPVTSTQHPLFESWHRHIRHLPAPVAEFEQWLFVHCAGVLFSRKAGELLTLPADQFGLHIDQRIDSIARLAELWHVSWQVLHHTPVSTKVIIYNSQKVREALTAVFPCITCELNYACRPNPDEFLKEIARRWDETGRIPHEIGFALGYPIKDVLGYMGLLPLACTGCCGWQIYGDPAPSLQMSREMLEARHTAIRLLHCRAAQDKAETETPCPGA